MLYEIIFSYLAIGAAWLAVEVWNGAGAHLGRRCADETRAVPRGFLPLFCLILAVMCLFVLGMMLIFWPYCMWDDWRRGEFLKPGRWDDEKE